MEYKSPLKSKTIWFNLISLAAVTASFLSSHELFQNPKAMAVFGIVVPALNMVLRFITTTGIKEKK
jgi:hypothetical protein